MTLGIGLFGKPVFGVSLSFKNDPRARSSRHGHSRASDLTHRVFWAIHSRHGAFWEMNMGFGVSLELSCGEMSLGIGLSGERHLAQGTLGKCVSVFDITLDAKLSSVL